MADMIQCPVCGAENPHGQKICQRCQSPLSSDSRFQPGQAPGVKDTGELEAVLPQWLRDARESAKQPDLGQPAEETPAASPKAPASNVDFLAGLQSQAGDNEDEEVPDWLASITGASSPKSKAPEEPADISGARWVETGTKNDFQQADSSAEEEEVPSWLAGIQSPKSGADEKDELTDWFRESAGDQPSFQPPVQFTAAADTPFSAPPSSDDTPDWLKQMTADAGQKESEPPAVLPLGSSDWFSDASSASSAAPQETFNLSSDTPDWLSSLGGESAPFAGSAPAESEPFASGGDIPSWLTPESDASKKSDSTPVWLQGEGESAGVPAWLDSNQAAPAAQPAPLQDDLLGDMPDWLKAAAPQTSIFDEPAKSPAAFVRDEPKTQQINAPFEAAPAFSEDAFRNEAGEALFTDMPDWLSNAMDQPPKSSNVPEPITGSDALAPDVLPSWVEAMRPSDQAMSNIVSASNDLTLESRGALAGLTGVLPAGVGFTPTSKPKAYSIKLNASDEQLKHAGILEQILAAETAPESIASEKPLAASRVLRWSLAFILLTVTIGSAILRTQFFSMPTGIPNELKFAVAVAQAIPEDAPVLVAVNYDPARAGEMEAAAAPLFDNLLLLKHPRLTFVASNESGAMLAERFMAGPLAVHNYQSQATYVNLGYLSGGQMGVRAFAQNPSLAAPLDIYSQPAWMFQPLQGVSTLDQFAAIVLITDDANAARTWVEQTQPARGVVPLIVVASAQAAPMIQPYFDSGQVSGVVSGLYGGALIERHYNSGRPGTARAYWDAYSIGMLLAMMLVLGGGFVSLALGLRDRAGMRKGN